MKKIAAIGIALAIMASLTACVSYQPPTEDMSGGDARVAVYGRNPLGFQPGTGTHVDPTLTAVVAQYDWLTSTAVPSTKELGVFDSIVSGGATAIGVNWTLYRDCAIGSGSYEQTTTVFPKNNYTVRSQIDSVVKAFENAGWVYSNINGVETLYETGTGIKYDYTLDSPKDFLIHINPISTNSFNLILDAQGCLSLGSLPVGKVIKNVNQHDGVWRAGYDKQSW